MKIRIIILFLSVSITSLKCFGQKQNPDLITEYHNYTDQMKTDIIPDSIFNLVNLTTLSITGMDSIIGPFDEYGNKISYNENEIDYYWKIKEIPAEIGNLTNLEYLQLNINAIKVIPEEVCNLKKLLVLDLSFNQTLTSIAYITCLDNLHALYLAECNLSSMPPELFKLRNLKMLELGGNNFTDVEKQRIMKELPNCEINF